VENSLQETAGSFSLWGMKLRSLLALAFCSTITFAAVPAQAEDCPDGVCELVFEYTGSGEYFTVPVDAENLSFEISGAAGGRGGKGGRVTGEFIDKPEGFWVFVGGEGIVNADAPGGYNGGGRSGGSRGNEGSGGGASDIRTGTNLSTRIVVAGGGGGGGGYAGAAGGVGGNLVAQNGGSGQGSGGSGGRASSGGSAGASNGGSSAQPGGFGVGGTGGSSWNAGGGGGGGGWYGGGGGGADDDSCCADAGGGGGGSSSASSSLVTSISHQAGVQTGAGQVIIRYEVPSKITSFTAVQQRFDEILLGIEVEGSFIPSLSDLVIEDISCVTAEPEVVDLVHTFLISGCTNAAFNVSLAVEAAALVTETASASIALELDLVGPNFEIAEIDPVDHQYLFELTGSEAHSGLSSDDIVVIGCGLSELVTERLSLNQCEEGEITITLGANAAQDSLGNFGPVEPVVFQFTRDTLAPTAQWLEPVITETDGTFSVVVALRHDDTLIEDAAVEFLADEISCLPATTAESGKITFEYVDCVPGTMEWTLPAFSLNDAAGNLGPSSDAVFEVTLVVTPAPEPELAPVLAEAPSQPIVQIPSQLQPQMTESLQPPVEAPQVIQPEIIEEILEFIEAEDAVVEQPETSDQESSPAAKQQAIQSPDTNVVAPLGQDAEIESVEVESVEIGNQLEPNTYEDAFVDPTPVTPTREQVNAALASRTIEPEERGFVSEIAPWLMGGTLAGALVFAAYRKMMVR